jgi:hypothetical protein
MLTVEAGTLDIVVIYIENLSYVLKPCMPQHHHNCRILGQPLNELNQLFVINPEVIYN